MDNTSPIKALILVSSLTPSPGASSSEKLATEVAEQLKILNVDSSIIRAVNYDIRPENETSKTMAAHLVHLARLLKANPYPPIKTN